MSWVAALLLLATGVFLPTLDVYSDIFYTIRLSLGNYYIDDECKSRGKMVPPYPKFGSFTLAPLIVSWIFVIIQWFKTERGWRKKLKTLPLLVCQVYPQYRALQVLHNAKWKRDSRWKEINKEWETGISHIGELVVT